MDNKGTMATAGHKSGGCFAPSAVKIPGEKLSNLVKRGPTIEGNQAKVRKTK